MRLLFCLLFCLLFGWTSFPHHGAAQPTRLGFAEDHNRVDHVHVAVDDDDDDEDGVRDADQERPPVEDARRIRLLGQGRARLRVQGPVRVLWAGRPLQTESIRLPADVRVQGLRPGTASLTLEQSDQSSTLHLQLLRIRFVDATGEAIDARTGTLGFSQQPPTPQSLPATETPSAQDPRAFFVAVEGFSGSSPLEGTIASYDEEGRRAQSRFSLAPLRGAAVATTRSPWLRLATHEGDARAFLRDGQILRAALRDNVEVQVAGARQSLRVGRPEVEEVDSAARHLSLVITILAAGGYPVVGDSPEGAQELAALQARSVADAWAQCFVGVNYEVRLRAPPPRALLSIADGRGLPALGGRITFQAGPHIITVNTTAGDTPQRTAERIAVALQQVGYNAALHRVPRTAYGAGDFVDLTVRDREGFWVPLQTALEPRPPTPGRAPEETLVPSQTAIPLSTDAHHDVRIGRVNLADGLDEFSNAEPGGTLEERTLVTLLRDDDPQTIDLFVVNRFSGGSRHGEAFVPSDQGSLAGTVIIDRRGASLAYVAWTAAHEVGHLLLDNPFHPDNFGADTPTRLMDSNRLDGSILGPQRLLPAECSRARRRSRRAPAYLQP